MTELRARTPSSEVDIDAGLVCRLLAAQQPDLSELSIETLDAGWDNAMFRLGTRWAVRLPRRAAAVPLLEREQRWIGRLPSLPIAIPTIERVGRPGEGYPWIWSVVRWLPGTPADVEAPGPDQAEPLAAFLAHLHVAAPSDAPRSEVRGIPLQQRAAIVARRLDRPQRTTSVISDSVWRAWQEAVEAPMDADPTWIHGDLHARNVLVERGRICAVLDWGDLSCGDKATDLAGIWMLLPSRESRSRARAAYPDTSKPLWARARGWAVAFGSLLLESGLDHHLRHAEMGEHTLRRVAADSGT